MNTSKLSSFLFYKTEDMRTIYTTMKISQCSCFLLWYLALSVIQLTLTSPYQCTGTYLTSIKISMPILIQQQQDKDKDRSFFPCTVTLCAWGAADSACRSELQLLDAYRSIHSHPLDHIFLDRE